MPLDTLQYSADPGRPTDRTYAIMLVFLAIIYAGGTVTMLSAARMPVPSGTPSSKWVFQFAAALCGFIVMLVVATLIFRSKSRSNACLIWTMAFNIFLLIVFPLGTAVGIYGLWNLDKPRYV